MIVVLTLSTLQLLRPTELRADSFASMPCWWCCSCSLWICSLIFRASWMAFITVSWSPNNAVEFRLDRISTYTHTHTHTRRSLDSKIRKTKKNNFTQHHDSGIYLWDIKCQNLAPWSPWMWLHTVGVCLNRVNLCVCVGSCLWSGDTLRSYPEMSLGPGLQVGWGYHPCWWDC